MRFPKGGHFIKKKYLLNSSQLKKILAIPELYYIDDDLTNLLLFHVHAGPGQGVQQYYYVNSYSDDNADLKPDQ